MCFQAGGHREAWGGAPQSSGEVSMRPSVGCWRVINCNKQMSLSEALS